MIDDFDVYLASGKVKKKTKDSVEASSLLNKALLRINNLRSLNETTASLVLEDAYESAREGAQALMSLDGFKPYSHEGTISFLIKFYAKIFTEYEFSQFDRFRRLRNDSVYKAETISIDDALKCVEFSKALLHKIKERLEQ